jgi:mannose-6-phosphate isomerase-like protein (cupin superfamily)
MEIRRLITGHADGRSTFVSDENVAGISLGEGGGQGWVLWGRDDTAQYPDDGSQPDISAMFPPVGGCRLTILRLAPGGSEAFDRFVVEAMAEFADQGQPGMHRTASLDFDIVLSGDVVLQLDDGEVELHAGDVVVQNGTRHRWVNRGSADAVLAVAIVGAEHKLV